MAMLTQSYCLECKESTTHVDNKCIKCEKIKHDKCEAEWVALTMEQKIEVLKSRISYLESIMSHTRY